MAKLVLGLVIGLALGAFVMHCMRDEGHVEANAIERTAGVASDDAHRTEREDGPDSALESPGDGERSRAAPRDSESNAPSDSEGKRAQATSNAGDVAWSTSLIGTELEAYARQGLRAGWKEVRPDEMPPVIEEEGLTQFGDGVARLPKSLGSVLATRESKKDLARDPTRFADPDRFLALLTDGDVGPLVDVASDPEKLAGLFRRSAVETTVRGDQHLGRIEDTLEEGTTLDFPPGVFLLDAFWKFKKPVPRDVTLRGAGMDATMIVLGSDVNSKGSLIRLALQDCTFFTDGHYFFDQRSGRASVMLNRVRVVGFDSGGGASCVFSFREGLALTVSDSRIEGGYGKSPEHGRLIEVPTAALIGRFERTRLSRLYLGLSRIRPTATLVFDNCEIVDVLDRPEHLIPGSTGVVFTRSPVHVIEEPGRLTLARDLNDLFPDWQSRLQR